jgi:Tol biopolymer transport system component
MRRLTIETLAAVSVLVLTGCRSSDHTATRSVVSGDTPFVYLLSMPAVSPEGLQLAWVDVTGVNKPLRVFVARPDGSSAHGLGPTWPDGVGPIAWTRAGIVAESSFSFFLISRTGRVTRIGPSGDVTFSVGGARVASGTAGCGEGTCAGPLVVIDIPSKKQWRLGRAGQWNRDPDLSPDGRRVAWASPDGILVGAVSGGAPHRLVAGGSCPQWSPNGHTIAYLTGNGSLHVVPESGGASRTLFKGANGCPSWSPDSTRVAFEPTTRISRLSVVDVNTHRVHRASARLGTTGDFAWSADGSHLYVSVSPRRAGGSCTELWLLGTATLRGRRLLDGCHSRR